MGTRCRNPEYEVDVRTTTAIIQRNSPFTTLVWGSLRLAPINIGRVQQYQKDNKHLGRLYVYMYMSVRIQYLM